MNREKIDLTSVISVLILGEKGAPYEVSGRLKFWGKIKGRDVEDVEGYLFFIFIFFNM